VKAIPIVVLMGAAVALGVLLGVEYLRRVRSKPVIIGIHLLLGAGGLEVFAVLLRGTPDGEVMAPGLVGNAAAGLMFLAMFTGLIAPMVGRKSRRTMNVALATHASVASLGFLLLLAWVIRGA